MLQVPWSNLGQQPVVAELDRLFLVAGPKEDDSSRPQGAGQAAAASNPEEAERTGKSQRVAAAEAAWLKVGGDVQQLFDCRGTTACSATGRTVCVHGKHRKPLP